MASWLTNARLPRWLAPLTIVVAALAALPALWVRAGIPWSRHSDLIAQFLSMKDLGARALREGTLALWNPSINCGTPALANPQSNYLFPLDGLFAVLPIGRAFGLALLANVVLAGLCMYAFARGRVRQRATALFAALAYMLAWRYLAMIHAGWLPRMPAYALLPLLLLTIERLVQHLSWRRLLALAAAVAVFLLQGDMQLTYYASVVCALWASLGVARAPAGLRLRTLSAVLAASALGILLAAPAWLPAVQFGRLSTRTSPSYEFFLYRPPRARELATLLGPDDQGLMRAEFWEKNFYFGIPVLLLAGLGTVRGGRRAWALAAAASFGVLLCFDSPLLRLMFHAFPGFSWFRQPPRVLLLVQFAMVLLAAIGLEALEPWLRRWRGVFPLVVTLSCAAVFLDSSVRMGWHIHSDPIEKVAPRVKLHDELSVVSAHGGRVAAVGRTVVTYGMAGWYGIDLVNGYTGLTLKHWIDYFAILQSGSSESIPRLPFVWTDLGRVARPDLLRALDVERIVSNQELPLAAIGFVHLAHHDQVPVFAFYGGPHVWPVEVYRDPNPLGAAYFATSIESVADEPASLAALAREAPATHARVMGLERAPSLAPPGSHAEMVARAVDRFTYRTQADGPGFLVIPQVWYPGWELRIDGTPAQLYRTNHALLGALLPAGSHLLDLRMTCPMLLCGLGLSAAAFLMCVLIAVRKRLR